MAPRYLPCMEEPAADDDAMPDDATLDEALISAAVLAATRELLWITTPADAKAVAVALVEALGGEVVPAETAGSAALPVDVSFGEGRPVLPTAARSSSVRAALARHLPLFVRDAHRAVELAARTQRLAEDAEIDVLTGLVNRRVVGRALGRLRPADVVVVLDLDGFKELNDTLGHEAGDELLAAFGTAATATVRARDLAGRYGGDEFVIVLVEVATQRDADAFLERLRHEWVRTRPHPVTFSAGAARVGEDPSGALGRADAAMYEAKRIAGDGWAWAGGRAPSDGDVAADRVTTS